jgi:hypothetical protein
MRPRNVHVDLHNTWSHNKPRIQPWMGELRENAPTHAHLLGWRRALWDCNADKGKGGGDAKSVDCHAEGRRDTARHPAHHGAHPRHPPAGRCFRRACPPGRRPELPRSSAYGAPLPPCSARAHNAELDAALQELRMQRKLLTWRASVRQGTQRGRPTCCRASPC